MSITKNIVDMMGGKINIDSKPINVSKLKETLAKFLK